METHTEGGLPQEEGERRSDGDFYKGKWILAPMVRIGILPFRLECLKYGAGIDRTVGHYTGRRKGGEVSVHLAISACFFVSSVYTQTEGLL